MDNDWIGLVAIFIMLFSIVFLGELIRKIQGWPSEFTRKFIHIGVGFWGFVAYYRIESMWFALIPPLSFVFINFISWKWTLLPAMEIADKRNLGTIYYPLSLCILVALFWKEPTRLIPVIGSMIMGLGDGFASIVGQRWGRHPFHPWHHTKSLEGSLAMFVFSFLAVCGVLAVMSRNPVSVILLRAVLMASAATVIEALSPWGIDNLTVPVASGLLYWLLFFQ